MSTRGSRRLAHHPPAPAAKSAEATLSVQPLLLAFGAEKASVPKLAKDSGTLHQGLKPLQHPLRVLSVTKSYVRQADISQAIVYGSTAEYNTAIPRATTGRIHRGRDQPVVD